MPDKFKRQTPKGSVRAKKRKRRDWAKIKTTAHITPAPATTTTAVAPTPVAIAAKKTVGTPVAMRLQDLAPKYSYVLRELKVIAIFAISIFAILIILSFLIK